MGKFRDLTGQRFGRLVVLKRIENRGRFVCWLCKCDCGEEAKVTSNSLLSGHTKSCGCLHKEMLENKWRDEDFRKMQDERLKRLWEDEEYRKSKSNKLTEVNKRRWEDEEYRETHTGTNHYNYKKELTDEDRQNRRGDTDYVNWAKQVKEQANFTCDCCGQVGGKLCSHHLNNWDKFKEQRYDLTNGVCLCSLCHREFHSWMGGNKKETTKEDYLEWKSIKKKDGDNNG